ncbi:type II toxin-antitoxin system VapB family antitoxin [Solicola gregarius]|uniref:Type II toxin-antitoxin system VapB family antitoxin n=1 Tax=Solicola gregarius TaxID=2908642 RepID=A0AA46YJ38_9ACTN|nr:type II toxin-antitoxin system VapB family antitoxin [Solicola gregarius]UYM03822.1 type II toxin-antitoxin system VapB family antitoxin [Solicola gregarius]
MRTTVNIDEHLLAEAKLIAARSHRTIGSVLEDALRRLIDEYETRQTGERYELPHFEYDPPGLRPGVDLYDKDQMAELLGDDERDTRALP